MAERGLADESRTQLASVAGHDSYDTSVIWWASTGNPSTTLFSDGKICVVFAHTGARPTKQDMIRDLLEAGTPIALWHRPPRPTSPKLFRPVLNAQPIAKLPSTSCSDSATIRVPHWPRNDHPGRDLRSYGTIPTAFPRTSTASAHGRGRSRPVTVWPIYRGRRRPARRIRTCPLHRIGEPSTVAHHYRSRRSPPKYGGSPAGRQPLSPRTVRTRGDYDTTRRCPCAGRCWSRGNPAPEIDAGRSRSGAGAELGPVLRWPITSRTTLRDGLYSYDPIGRLREEHLAGCVTTTYPTRLTSAGTSASACSARHCCRSIAPGPASH